MEIKKRAGVTVLFGFFVMWMCVSVKCCLFLGSGVEEGGQLSFHFAFLAFEFEVVA